MFELAFHSFSFLLFALCSVIWYNNKIEKHFTFHKILSILSIKWMCPAKKKQKTIKRHKQLFFRQSFRKAKWDVLINFSYQAFLDSHFVHFLVYFWDRKRKCPDIAMLIFFPVLLLFTVVVSIMHVVLISECLTVQKALIDCFWSRGSGLKSPLLLTLCYMFTI